MTLVLPNDPSDEELARDWLLSEQDLVEVRRCRGADKRHSFAIQLCTLRAYGRFLGKDYGAVPIRIVNHVGSQLGMPPVLFAVPPERKETDAEHERRIRAYLGFRTFDAAARVSLRRGFEPALPKACWATSSSCARSATSSRNASRRPPAPPSRGLFSPS
jgi:hypothetical protein